MGKVIEDEVASSKALGYNLGIKLIRGAYLNEERALAKKLGKESPVWDTMEQTHECYNKCLKLVLENLGPQGVIILASHNKDSIDIA